MARRNTKRKIRPRMLATMTPTNWPLERLPTIGSSEEVAEGVDVVSLVIVGMVVVGEDVVGLEVVSIEVEDSIDDDIDDDDIDDNDDEEVSLVVTGGVVVGVVAVDGSVGVAVVVMYPVRICGGYV